MLLWFDKNGILKESLSYGSAARAGTTAFKITAYFDGIDPDIYGSASIKLKRPDMRGSLYPILFMSRKTMTYHSSIESSSFFENGHEYECYEFDFNDVRGDDEEPVCLLDTSGMWKASIVLSSLVAYAANVVGRISFNVEESVYDEDDATEFGIDDIIAMIGRALATKLDKASGNYLRVSEEFTEDAEDGNVLKEIFHEGDIVYDKASKSLYAVGEMTDNTEEAGYAYAEYELIVDLGKVNDVASLQATVAMVENALTNINGYVLSEYQATDSGPGEEHPYKLITKGALMSLLTKEQAADYMEIMCGSRFVPVYDRTKPQNSIFVMKDGTIWKPQFDTTYGLRLFAVESPFWTKSTLTPLTDPQILEILEE